MENQSVASLGSGDAHMQLANAYLFERAKVTKVNMTVFDANSAVGASKNNLHTLFSQIDVYLIDMFVTRFINTYVFRAYVVVVELRY